MALPQGDVAVEQPPVGGVEAVYRLDDGSVTLDGKALVILGKGDESADFVTTGVDGQLLVSQILGEDGAHGVIGPFDQLLAERQVRKLVVHDDDEAVALLLRERFQLDFADAEMLGLERGECLLDGRLQIAGMCGTEQDCYEDKQEDIAFLFHVFRMDQFGYFPLLLSGSSDLGRAKEPPSVSAGKNYLFS